MTRSDFYRRALPFCVACASITACADSIEPRTEIVIVVDSDLAAPTEFDSVAVRVMRDVDGGTEFPTKTGELTSDDDLPLTVGLLHTGGTLGPLLVTAEALKGDEVIVSQLARISFVKGKRMTLRMNLVRACLPSRITCAADKTCIDGACSAVDRDDDLTDWTGLDAGLPVSDAGHDSNMTIDAGDAGNDAASEDAGDASDADAGDAGELSDAGDFADTGVPCRSMAEACNDLDDDCDGMVDENYRPFNTPERCGDCNTECPTNLVNAHSICNAELVCETICSPLTDNCDADDEPSDTPGCEVNLTSPSNCGACGVECSGATPFCGANGLGGVSCVGACGTLTLCDGSSCVDVNTDPLHCGSCAPCAAQPNATASCGEGECDYTCLAGFDSCTDNNDDNGCETNTRVDALHCGECGDECPDVAHSSPRCASGDCTFDCDLGYTDCNSAQPGGTADGCETHTDVDINNCGTCNNVCPARAAASPACRNGECGVTCNPGRGNCDGVLSNGCETNTTNNKNHCGACGRACTGLGLVCCRGSCATLCL